MRFFKMFTIFAAAGGIILTGKKYVDEYRKDIMRCE